jgi:predicted ester cyclase
MSKEANLQAQIKFGEAVVSGRLEGIRDVVAADCIDHDPAEGQVPGPEGFIFFFGEFRKAFPDLKLAVEHLVQDDDNVAFAYTVADSRTASWSSAGAAPTNSEFFNR